MSEKRRDHKGRILRTGESQRKDLTYMYRFTDAAKRRHTVYANTLTELRKKEEELLAKQSLGLTIDYEKKTVNEILEFYINQRKAKVRTSTLENYYTIARKIASDPFGSLVATAVKTSITKSFILRLEAEGYSYGTIRNMLNTLQSAFNVLIDDEQIIKNPCSFSLKELLSVEPQKREGLSLQQQESLMAFIAEHKRIRKYQDEIEVLLHTGIRIGEFCAITRSDVDFINHKLRINKQMVLVRGELHISPPKSKCGVRFIPLDEVAEEALRNLIKKRNTHKVEPIVDGVGGFILLSTRRTARQPSCYNSIFEIIERDYNKAHKEPITITPHIMRHTFCTNMIRKNIDPKSLQYIMGHASADLSYNTYGSFTYEDAEAGFRRIEAAL